jgi:hypothetical protein
MLSTTAEESTLTTTSILKETTMMTSTFLSVLTTQMPTSTISKKMLSYD